MDSSTCSPANENDPYAFNDNEGPPSVNTDPLRLKGFWKRSRQHASGKTGRPLVVLKNILIHKFRIMTAGTLGWPPFFTMAILTAFVQGVFT